MMFETEKERSWITGVSGGILPVYPENGKPYAAACSCVIGRHMANQCRFPMYDQIPGTSPNDTKHDLIMAHFRLPGEKDGEDTDTDFPF